MDKVTPVIKMLLIDNNILTEYEVNNDLFSAAAAVADQIDSLLYISLMVAIEEELDIEIPDSLLGVNVFKDISTFINQLNNIVKEENYLC